MIKNKEKGFTLVELLCVVVILGIVLAIAVPATSKYILKARTTAFYANVSGIVDSIKKADDLNQNNKPELYVSNEEGSMGIKRTEDIESITIIKYIDKDGNRKYSVVAGSTHPEVKEISTEDFYSITPDDTTWDDPEDGKEEKLIRLLLEAENMVSESESEGEK